MCFSDSSVGLLAGVTWSVLGTVALVVHNGTHTFHWIA